MIVQSKLIIVFFKAWKEYFIRMFYFFTEELIKEIHNDIVIADQRLEEAIANKLKNHDFLLK
jgi:hypothetical protein